MGLRRWTRAVAVAAAAVLLAGCAGLPTSGPPNAGLPVGEDSDSIDFTPVAQGPAPGAGPEEIVAGFLEAGVDPAGSWLIANQFLTEGFSRTWKPESSVAIDSSVSSRVFDSDVDADDEDADAAVVQVQFDQTASVDATGAYSEFAAPGKSTYRLQRVGGEWRISEAPDGIVLDADGFGQAFSKHALQFFDQSWTHLVPDVRWFPKRGSTATTLTRALLSGDPSPWLAPAVRSAFPTDIELVGDSVPLDSSQVALVSLSRNALSESPQTLARMRTQLEATLADADVSEVRFIVDGATLDADTVTLDDSIVDPGVLVLTEDTFGTAANGEISPVTSITAQIAKIADPIAAIDVALDGASAAVQMRDGAVFLVRDGNTDELDQRRGLIGPSLDPFGYTWTVPRDAPRAVEAWDRAVTRHTIDNAWPDATAISHLRVAADGSRVAAVITSGGQRRLVVASVVRGEASVPVQLGEPIEIARLTSPALGVAWVGSDAVALLSHAEAPVLTTHVIGGPALWSAAPAGAASLAGAKTSTGMRVLASDGSVYAQRISSWQESVSGVLVLGTRAGY